MLTNTRFGWNSADARRLGLSAALAVCLCSGVTQAQELQPTPEPIPEVLVGRLWLQDETLSMPSMGSGSFLGIGVADVTAEMAERLKMGEPRGVVVTAVSEGSPAEKAGIRVKDVLLSYNGSSLEGRQQLTRMVSETPAGRTVRLRVLRDGNPVDLSIVTAARRPMKEFEFGTAALEKARDAAERAKEAAGRVWVVMPDIPRMLTVYHSKSLGIDSEPLTPQLAEFFGVKQGALVREVTENSAAAKAGVKAGDVITSFAEQPVSKPADLSKILKEQKTSASPLKLSLVRNQKEITLPVVLEDAEEGGQRYGVRPLAPRPPRAIAIGNAPRK
ncbi:MAG: PDZ domain-containing protein [Bryobacterales bacterium]|nr:PDZ domain-containing protein [Bryobacterales bacterium]